MEQLKNVRIGLIEDDNVTARVYARWLEIAGAAVHHFSTVAEFQQQMEIGDSGWIDKPKIAPDVLLCDLVLPDGSGTDVLQLWRRHFSRSPVLIITAFATVENAVSTMKMGAFDFIRKPVEPEELILALQRAYEHGQLIKENDTLSFAVRIFGMAQTLAGIQGKLSALKTFARLLLRECDADEAFVFVHTPLKKKLECLFDCRAVGKTRTLPELVFQSGLSALIKRERPVIDDYQALDKTNAPEPVIHSFPERMFIELPSQTGNTAYVVLLGKNIHNFMNELHPIINQACRSFQQGDVQEWMQALSYVDDLTGLFNQRFLEVAVNSEIARSMRYNTQFCIMFFDLDKFKQVNDTHGHIVGSQILKEVSKLCLEQLRDSDVLIRYGGDEFVAILPNTSLSGALVVGERIRTVFEQKYFDVSKVTGIPTAINLNVTASIGISCYPDNGLDRRELIQKADEAMYRAKELGKNRVCLSPVYENHTVSDLNAS